LKKLVSYKTASKICVISYGILLIFHLFLIIGGGFLDFIPIDIVWGGSIASKDQFIKLEMISLAVLILCLFITLIKARYLKLAKLYPVSHYAMWLLFAYFLFNTLGNIMAKTLFENAMAIIAITLSLSTLRLALEK